MERMIHLLEALQAHLQRRPLLLSTVTGTTGVLLALAVSDYRRFKALGPGGVPYNVLGWLIVTFFLRPLCLSKRGGTSVADYPASGAAVEILSLPMRTGSRPDVGEIIPQRQLNQHASADMRKNLQAVFDQVVSQNPSLLEYKLSHYEKHNLAIYVQRRVLAQNPSTIPETAIVAQGEIGHIHPDSSFHLYFNPADARVVLEKGWGERHRLARTQPWYLGRERNLFGVGPTYILVYGPRDEKELEAAKVFLNASVRFMTGKPDIQAV